MNVEQERGRKDRFSHQQIGHGYLQAIETDERPPRAWRLWFLGTNGGKCQKAKGGICMKERK